MKRLSANTVAEVVGGELIAGNGNLPLDRFSYRFSRIPQGSLHFDFYHGKRPFIISEGCECAVVTDSPSQFSGRPGVALIRVNDVDAACWRFVEYYRGLFDIPVIGVTGTCGKTTTKEMIRHILAGRYKVNATYKSYNAEFRHLSYLTEIDGNTQAAVYEMGVASAGDLATACRIFKPQVGVITNIGVDHLQAFGGPEAYIRAKAEFLGGLGEKGIIILNADDENTRKIDLSGYKGRVVYFGKDERSDFRLIEIKGSEKSVEVVLGHGGRDCRFTVPGCGEFNAYNAAAAVAAAHAVGIDVDEAGARLATFRHVERHFEIKKGINGSTVVDDTWSTNPTSTEAALRLLKSIAKGRRTIAALGRMSLLGRQSRLYHLKVGEKLPEIGIDTLVVIGRDAREIGIGALQGGMNPDNIYFCKDSSDTGRVLLKLLGPDTVALVKTSMLTSNFELIQSITAG